MIVTNKTRNRQQFCTIRVRAIKLLGQSPIIVINKRSLSIVLTTILSFLVACSNPTPSIPTTTILTVAPAIMAIPTTSVISTYTPKAGATSTPAAAIIADTQSSRNSLDALRSYRSQFIYSFEGKNEQGALQRGVVEVLQEVRNTTGDRHTHWTITGDPAGSNVGHNILDWYTVDGLTYLYTSDPEPKCSSVSSEKGSVAPVTSFNLSDIIGGIEKAELIEKGIIINEVMSDHYTFDQPDATAYGYNSATGDVWVAPAGEYVVRYTGHATGENGPLGKLAEGVYAWEYNLEQVNKLEVITLPEECADQKPATDIPLPSNATDKINLGQLTTFNSPDKFMEVADFFSKVLPKHGWTAGEVYSRGDQAVLNFTKDGRTLLITIMLDQSGGLPYYWKWVPEREFIANYELTNSSVFAAMMKSFLCNPFTTCVHHCTYW